MIVFEIQLKRKPTEAYAYHEWDVRDKEVVDCMPHVTKKDIGKYVRFNDGTGLYAEILAIRGNNGKYVVTSCGIYYKGDIISCIQPKYKDYSYANVPFYDESCTTRPVTKGEKKVAYLYVAGKELKNKKGKKIYLTRRMKEFLIEDFKKKAVELGWNENFMATKLMEWINDGGRHAFKSMEAMCHINGVEIAPNNKISINNTNVITGPNENQKQLEGLKDKQLPSGSKLIDIMALLKAERKARAEEIAPIDITPEVVEEVEVIEPVIEETLPKVEVDEEGDW